MGLKKLPPLPDYDPEDKLPGIEDPYPEFRDELYEGYVASGITPEMLTEPGRTEYKAWLAARAKRN